jgi:hypothetical protein
MIDKHTKGEMHGCIMCGKLYQLYVVSDADGKFIGARVMSAGGKIVPNESRPLVACEKHSNEEIESAVKRIYGQQKEDDE